VWQPSTAEIAVRAGIDAADVIRADQNTSPFTPPWAGDVAQQAAATVSEYPAARYEELRAALAAYLGAGPDMIVPGAGADELILLAARAFLRPGSFAVAESPTYAMYRIATFQQSAGYEEVPRALPEAAFPASLLADAARGASVTWLCIPHNQLGDRAPGVDVDRVVAATAGVTVVDAAYAAFAGDTWTEYVAAGRDVVVLGTLSKAFALAGARVGYALASPELADALEALRPPGSVSSISVALALRSLSEIDWMEEHVARIAQLRTALTAGLRDLGLQPRDSTTNFVLVEIGGAAPDVTGALMRRGIVARSFGVHHPLSGHLRFTVRRADQQERMLEALHQEMR
jgi:histidinol-phosphate aminotransferase